MKAKVAYVTAFYVVFFGLLTLMESLDAPAELMVAVLTMVMVVMIGPLGALWEFSEDPPRWVRKLEARRNASSRDH